MVVIRSMCFWFLLWRMAAAADWYVTTNGTGDGSIGSPWSLQTATTNALLQPGDTVWLRAGTYFPVVTNSYLEGALGWWTSVGGVSNNPVTYRSFTNEWAAIDRRWLLTSYVRFRDLEFFDSLKGHNPTNESYPNGPWVQFVMSSSVGDEWINCVIHDVDNCWGSSASTATVRGCILWHVGWNDFEHVCYPNAASFIGNICAWPLNRTFNNSVGESVCNSNIIFGSGKTIGVSTDNDINFGVDKATIIGNVCLNSNQTFSIDVTSGSVISNNICVGGKQPVLLEGTNSLFEGNMVYRNSSDANILIYFSATNPASWTVDYNSYYALPGSAITFANNGVYGWTFGQWQGNNGFDLNGTTNISVPPDTVRVIGNIDQSKRCHIAVLNWSLQNNVTVSLAGVLNAGDSYRLYSAQNYNAGAIRGGIYDGTNISVPMTNLTTAAVLYGTNENYQGQTITQPPATSPEFGAFVVLGEAPSHTLTATAMNVGTISRP